MNYFDIGQRSCEISDSITILACSRAWCKDWCLFKNAFVKKTAALLIRNSAEGCFGITDPFFHDGVGGEVRYHTFNGGCCHPSGSNSSDIFMCLYEVPLHAQSNSALRRVETKKEGYG